MTKTILTVFFLIHGVDNTAYVSHCDISLLPLKYQVDL